MVPSGAHSLVASAGHPFHSPLSLPFQAVLSLESPRDRQLLTPSAVPCVEQSGPLQKQMAPTQPPLVGMSAQHLPAAMGLAVPWECRGLGCIRPYPHTMSVHPSFPYREEHPKENCTFHPQPQTEEQADGLTSTTAPWTLVPGCCIPRSTSLGLHLLGSCHALPATHCVSVPFQLPQPA